MPKSEQTKNSDWEAILQKIKSDDHSFNDAALAAYLATNKLPKHKTAMDELTDALKTNYTIASIDFNKQEFVSVANMLTLINYSHLANLNFGNALINRADLLSHNLVHHLQYNYLLTSLQIPSSGNSLSMQIDVTLKRNRILQSNFFNAIKRGDLIDVSSILATSCYQALLFRDQALNTALHCAVVENKPELVKYLVSKMQENNIMFNIKNAEGKTAHDLASNKPTLLPLLSPERARPSPSFFG